MQTTEYRQTRADGSFEITAVGSEGSGTITVLATFPGLRGYDRSESRPVTISFGGNPVPVPPVASQQQVQITAQYSPVNPQIGEMVLISGTLSTAAGQPVSGVLISAMTDVMSGTCQGTARNTVNTDANGNYQFTYEPPCAGSARMKIGFDGTSLYRPVQVSFNIPIGRSPSPIPMDPIVMMSAP
jgi:hypothetical protein